MGALLNADTAAKASAVVVEDNRTHASDLPPDFDPARYPIIALHFYGVTVGAEVAEEAEAA